MRVKAVSVRCFELFTLEGNSLGLFKVESQWHGLQSLQSVDGKTAVLVNPQTDTHMGAIFDAVFGEHRAECEVVKASPDIAVVIANQQGGSKK